MSAVCLAARPMVYRAKEAWDTTWFFSLVIVSAEHVALEAIVVLTQSLDGPPFDGDTVQRI